MIAGLHLGDCLKGLRALPDKSIDHVITDPPYSRDVYVRARAVDSLNGSGRAKRIGPGVAALKAGAIGSIDKLCAPVATELVRVCRRWLIVFSDVEFCHRWREEIERAGGRYVRTGAWVKNDAMPQMTGDRPGVGFEPATIAHAAGRALRWNAGGALGVWAYGIAKGERHGHPCPKPLALMLRLVRDFTDPGDVILDPFAGSATTGVAAIQLGRRFVGWEKDRKFYRAARRRLAGAREQLELFGGMRVMKPRPRAKQTRLALLAPTRGTA